VSQTKTPLASGEVCNRNGPFQITICGSFAARNVTFFVGFDLDRLAGLFDWGKRLL
jgi:hypothetical protein